MRNAVKDPPFTYLNNSSMILKIPLYHIDYFLTLGTLSIN